MWIEICKEIGQVLHMKCGINSLHPNGHEVRCSVTNSNTWKYAAVLFLPTTGCGLLAGISYTHTAFLVWICYWTRLSIKQDKFTLVAKVQNYLYWYLNSQCLWKAKNILDKKLIKVSHMKWKYKSQQTQTERQGLRDKLFHTLISFHVVINIKDTV